jgi:RNA polymerase sigma factor (sigma-70 family)
MVSRGFRRPAATLRPARASKNTVKFTDIELAPELVARAQGGDRAALAAFYGAFARPAYTLIRRIVPGPAADDLLQDAFIDAIRGLPGFAGRAPLGAWFRSVVVRRCYMHLRSPWQRGRELVDELLERLESQPAQPALALDLERALARLPALARLIVWLHDVEGYTHEEIAAATGRTASFSKSQLSRAHALLRGALGGDSGAPPGEDAHCTLLADCARSSAP